MGGSYSVNLPDGRTQHVAYHANDYDGYVADVTYDGVAAYANTVAAHPVAHAVAHTAVIGQSLGHAVALGHGVGLGHGAVLGHGLGLGHGAVLGHGVGLGHGAVLGHGVGLGHGISHLG